VPPAGDAPPVDLAGDLPVATSRAFRLEGVASWKGNAAGAYSIVHEVVCDPALSGSFRFADPELTKLGLHAGFGVLVGACESGKLWEQVKTMVAHGHDVFSNTQSNLCLTGNTMLAAEAGCAGANRSANYAVQLDQAARTLQDRTGVAPGFLVLPYDLCDPAVITRARGLGYLGARCGGGGGMGINATAFADPFKVTFDLWGPGYSAYRTAAPCMGVAAGAARPSSASAACRSYVLTRYLDDIVSRKGWGMRGFHGFDDDMGGFQPIAPADYRAHLEVVAQRVQMNQLWVEGPTVVVRYRMARQHCAAPTLEGATLKFPAPSAECSKHATELSYLVRTADGADLPALKLTQMGKSSNARKLGPGQFAVDADPTRGDAVLAE
jgi:hypothetical protein